MCSLRIPSLLLALLLACSGTARLNAADLFGTGSQQEDGLTLGKQQQIYNQIFGSLDQEADSTRERLQLARQIKAKCAEAKFEEIRPYMLMRIGQLIERSRSYEACQLRVFIFNQQYRDQQPEHAAQRERIELMTDLLKKAPREKRLSIAQEITVLCNQMVRTSLAKRQLKRACEDYELLEYWLKKTGDRDGADMADDCVDAIEDYLDEREEIDDMLAAIKAGDQDPDHRLEAGRFLAADGEWSQALPHLRAGGARRLATVAELAQNTHMTADQMGQCAIAVGKALMQDDINDHQRLYRSLLRLGVQLKQALATQEAQLSQAMKIRYTLASEEWEYQLKQLGHDPMRGIDVGPIGASVDEARLLRMGWEMAFNHEDPMVSQWFENNPQRSVDVEDGIMVLKCLPQSHLSIHEFPELNRYRAVKIRFHFKRDLNAARIHITGPGTWQTQHRAGISIRNNELRYQHGGTLHALESDDWNDLTMSWDGKAIQLSLNGKAFETATPFPLDTPDRISISIHGREAPTEMLVQSVLLLPHDP